MTNTYLLIGVTFISHFSHRCDAFLHPATTIHRLSPSSTTSCTSGTTPVLSSTTSNENEKTIESTTEWLKGATIFEQWFQSKIQSENDTSQYVRHNMFSNGRGLEYIGKKGSGGTGLGDDTAIIQVPKDLVLRSVMRRKKDDDGEDGDIAQDWDAVLSVKLLKECLKGKNSDVYGYCSLLTRGQDFQSSPTYCPPSTAPDALRNWSPSQLEQLSSSCPRGEKLVNFSEKQIKDWNKKYDALDSSDRRMFTRSQFLWAMEAVNSRAFKGDFGLSDNPIRQLSSALLPIAAAGFALNYSNSNPIYSDERVTLLLGLIAFAPLLLNFFDDQFGNPGQGRDAVLLPFIDSANHDEGSRSIIQLDPAKGMFTLCVSGRNCFRVDEDNDMSQLYISYGVKRDTELLLNYGFLPGVKTSDDGAEDSERDVVRKALIDAFVDRNR